MLNYVLLKDLSSNNIILSEKITRNVTENIIYFHYSNFVLQEAKEADLKCGMTNFSVEITSHKIFKGTFHL